MASVVMAYLFGLFGGDPAQLVDKHYVQIEHEAELPEINRRAELPSGRPYFPYAEAGYGYRIGSGHARWPGLVPLVRRRLGDPLTIPYGDEVRTGYMWRHRDNPGRGMLLIVEAHAQSVHLSAWHEKDKARTGRIGMAAENEIYRWFDWLTAPPADE